MYVKCKQMRFVKGQNADDLSDFILSLQPHMAKRFGISRQVLSYWKGRIRMGKTIEVYGKTGNKLKRVMQKVINPK